MLCKPTTGCIQAVVVRRVNEMRTCPLTACTQENMAVTNAIFELVKSKVTGHQAGKNGTDKKDNAENSAQCQLEHQVVEVGRNIKLGENSKLRH